MGRAIIIYNNLIKISYMSPSFPPDPNYPVSNVYDDKTHTLMRWNGSGEILEFGWHSPVGINTIAFINHNIYNSRDIYLPLIEYDIDGSGDYTFTKNGSDIILLPSTKFVQSVVFTLFNIRTPYPLIGEIWLSKRLDFPYPLEAPLQINQSANFYGKYSEAGHFLSANYRNTIFNYRFSMSWVEASFVEGEYKMFIDEAVKGQPFIFIPDSDKLSEIYFARIKQGSQVMNSRRYSNVYDRIGFEMEMFRYQE